MRLFLSLVVLATGGAPAFATQSCDTSIYPLSAPTSRFVDNGDGTVTDSNTHMMWMRCSMGQTWTGSACADWRMPRIPELANIIERQCAGPRTNITVFPDTPAGFFWTASERRGAGNENQAYVLSFGPEGTAGDMKSVPHYVRLVRNAS